MPEGKDKNIIDVPENEEWALWKRIGAHLINASGTFLWLIVTYLLLIYFNENAQLAALRDASMNIVAPAVAYSILSLIAGLTLASWLFPYFSPRRIAREGEPIEKAACLVFWGLFSLALSFIIAAGVR
jgi:hypothetical protein